MITLLSNLTGQQENFIAGGNSSVWDVDGTKIATLSDAEQALIVIDIKSKQIHIIRLARQENKLFSIA